MQTFLPHKDFRKSAQCLDRQRLGKQRVEVLQLLKALNGETKGWRNHPATKMWEHAQEALINYGIEICKEWKSRGYKDTCQEKIEAYIKRDVIVDNKTTHIAVRTIYPPSFSEELHKTHRAALLAKNPEHYGQFGWEEKPEINYVWN